MSQITSNGFSGLIYRFSPFFNGWILALFFTVFQIIENDKLRTIACLLVAGSYFGFNYYVLKRRIFFSITPDRLLGYAFLLINAYFLSQQNAGGAGFKVAIENFTVQVLIVVMCVALVSVYGPDYAKMVFLTLALTFIWFTINNLLVDKLGFGKAELIEREKLYTSHFAGGGYRYQTVLYSAAQISGLLRWAIPLILAYIVFIRCQDRLLLFLLGIFVLLAVIVCVLVDFRSAIFPLIAFVIWFLVGKVRARVLLCGAFVVYMYLAPLLFGIVDIGALMQQITPDSILSIAGQQRASDVFTLSGRSYMWHDAFVALLEGHNIFIGDGHANFDAFPWLSDQTPFLETVKEGAHLSFHQSVLDLIFIYGLCPMVLITVIFGWTLLKGMVNQVRGPLMRYPLSNTHFALVVLGLMGIANCHDSFFTSHNWYYIICVIACWVIWDDDAWLRYWPARSASLG